MATYNASQLYGGGTPIESLIGGTTYNFTFSVPSSLSGSAYFTNESVRNEDGFYLGMSSNAEGIVDNLLDVEGLIQSSYIFSVIVKKDGASFDFTPTTTIPISGSFLRTTGGIGLIISV